MTEMTQPPRFARRSLLAAIMAVVLVGAVAAAWLMERAGQRRVDAGAKVIADLRSKGLADGWPRELRIDWYLTRVSAKPVGWRALARWRTDDGDLAGTDIMVYPEVFVMEQWVLSPDMSRGEYSSVEQAGRGAGTTDILLEAGIVTIRQDSGRRASLPAPANYIPEGALNDVVRRSGQLADDAQFSIVFNERFRQRGTFDFDTIRVRRLGRTEDGGLRVRRIDTGGGRTLHTDYEFDKDGRILGTATGGSSMTPVSAEKVTKRYEDADKQVREAIESWQNQLEQRRGE